jgi:hypothetical protein
MQKVALAAAKGYSKLVGAHASGELGTPRRTGVVEEVEEGVEPVLVTRLAKA